MCRKHLSVKQRNWILCGFCSVPLILGACSLTLGSWLCLVVVHNSNLPANEQLHFEKVSPWTSDHDGTGSSVYHLLNDSPFTHTPVDNLCLYLLTLSFFMVTGGLGRGLTTGFFCVHLCHNRLTAQLFWAWLALSTLAVTIEVIVTYDILQTLSHNDVAPPYSRDFFFSNDSHLAFYWLCHILRYFVWIDLGFSAAAQTAVCFVYRLKTVTSVV